MRLIHTHPAGRDRSAIPSAAAIAVAASAFLLVNLPRAVDAQGGPRGGGGPGSGGRGMPAAFQDNIHALFDNHETIKRKVEKTEDGYRSTTTSTDPKVAAILQEHVAQMKQRFDGGRPVRRWDPAFEEFFAHYDDMDVAIEKIDGGLRVTVKGRTPEASAVARNHAGIVSRFVAHGWDEAHASHPPALDGDGNVVASAAPLHAAGKSGDEDCAEDGGEKCTKCEKAAAVDPDAKAAKAGCCGCCRRAAAGPKKGGKDGACCRQGKPAGDKTDDEAAAGAES